MMEAYRNMELFYTNDNHYMKEVLDNHGIACDLYIDTAIGKAEFFVKEAEKCKLEYLAKADSLQVNDTLMITVTETNGTIWAFKREDS